MKKVTILSLLPIAVIMILTGCTNASTKETASTSTTEEKVKVKVVQVHKTEVEQIFEYTATIQANTTNNIAPLMAGRINKIYVEVGDYVKKDDLLVQMDDANLAQAKSQLDNLELTFSRIDELYKVGGVAKSDWDAQKTALDVARTSYKNLLDNTQLHSPIFGIITARRYDAGDLYAGTPILQIQQIEPVKLTINVSETFFTTIKKGMEAKVVLQDVYGNEEFTGSVDLIYPTIDARTHTFQVELLIANHDKRVRPGMYARVDMNFGSKNNIVVPDIAIVKQTGSGDRYVYVCKEGKVSYNKVVLGRRVGSSYELLSGVEDGDMVVIAGINRLNNGKEVEVIQ